MTCNDLELDHLQIRRMGRISSQASQYPQEVRVQHETCSTICGTPVQAIFDQKNLTGLAGGVKEGQNMAQNGPRFYIFLASEPSRSP